MILLHVFKQLERPTNRKESEMESPLNHLEQSYVRDAIARNQTERLRPFVEEYGVEAVRDITSKLMMGDRANKIFEEALPWQKK